MVKLWAISDIHVSHKFNLDSFVQFLHSLPTHQKTSSSSLDPGDDVVNDIDEDSIEEENEDQGDYRKDGLILAGDISEKLGHLRTVFKLCVERFGVVWWCPGNHELYTLPSVTSNVGGEGGGDEMESEAERDKRLDYQARGERKYDECVGVAREYGIKTPEDEFVCFEYDLFLNHGDSEGGKEKEEVDEVQQMQSLAISSMPENKKQKAKKRKMKVVVCPIFTLYDYTFRPAHLSTVEEALDWAMEEGIRATDEHLLHPDPYLDRSTWCRSLIERFEARLKDTNTKYPGVPLVLVNHWPLLERLVHIPRVPRFVLWCGTTATKEWHREFNAQVVVTGHLHVRRTDWIDGVRFEEVSLGYPRQWENLRLMGLGVEDVLREILPGDERGRQGKIDGGTVWRGNG